MTTNTYGGAGGVVDPEFIAFVQWLTPKSQDETSGPLAVHWNANGFLQGGLSFAPTGTGAVQVGDGGLLGTDGNFQPIMIDGRDPEGFSLSAPIAWISAPPGAANQALRIHSFTELQLSIRNFGPNVTTDEYNAALAAYA